MSVSSEVSVIRHNVAVAAYLAGDWPPNSQLIDGEVVVSDPAMRHQIVVGNLFFELSRWSRAAPGRGLALFGCNWVLPVGANVYKPDVWWVADERRPPGDAVWLEPVPDLVVEVRSPGTWRYDQGVKRERYEASGLAELWLVDPHADGLVVLRRSSPEAAGFDVELAWGVGDTATSPQLDGFSLPLATVFER